jgi:hypothetical protein
VLLHAIPKASQPPVREKARLESLLYGTRAAWPRGFFLFDARAAPSALSKVTDFRAKTAGPNVLTSAPISLGERCDPLGKIVEHPEVTWCKLASPLHLLGGF